MFLKTDRFSYKDYAMVTNDYYEKFEKLSGQTSKIKNMSVCNLQNLHYSNLCAVLDKNYKKTWDLFYKKGIIDSCDWIVKLVNDHYVLAYAMITRTKDDITRLQVHDIIIHKEDKLNDLADGEINIRYNIYNNFITFIEDFFNNYNLSSDFTIEYCLVDSNDIYRALIDNQYILNEGNVSIEGKIPDKTTISMSKYFAKKEEKDELRLTRKQN